ncbi:MAG TPA: DotU family type IV/VI secretion system protein [Burkholderiaceae bacterium]|nr:DotU family type IV/VI secretion system protein [Burkholderiaceae bacterium]
MPRLFDFYAPVFTFGLALDAPSTALAAPLTGGEAQQRARRLLDRARSAALAAGKPLRQVESAGFALVAWFDELMARHPRWADSAAPLQMQLFNSTNAQTEFFHHLSALKGEDAELREIYWYALALGFKGQYYFESEHRDGEIAKLIALHAAQLPLAPIDARALRDAPLVPQPALPFEPFRSRDPQHRQRAMLRTAAALLALVPLGLLLSALLGRGVDAPSSLGERLEGQLQAYACADLAATVDAHGNARVRGFVPQREDIDRVQRDVGRMPGVTTADVDLQLRPWPYCEVVTMLKPYLARNRQGRAGLQVDTPTARDGQLREGDPVRVLVRTPAHDAQLWVDYYTADGAVLHFRSDGAQTVATAPGQTLTFGTDVPSSWLVSPPFGTVLVTAVAVPQGQLAAESGPPPFELASAYLLRLRERLGADRSGEKTVADYVFLETVER